MSHTGFLVPDSSVIFMKNIFVTWLMCTTQAICNIKQCLSYEFNQLSLNVVYGVGTPLADFSK